MWQPFLKLLYIDSNKHHQVKVKLHILLHSQWHLILAVFQSQSSVNTSVYCAQIINRTDARLVDTSYMLTQYYSTVGSYLSGKSKIPTQISTANAISVVVSLRSAAMIIILMALPRRHFHRVALHPPGRPTALRPCPRTVRRKKIT